MQKTNQSGASKAERGGDTSRTSNQGRKEASGGRKGARGNPEIDEATHSPKSGQNKERKIGEKRKGR
jgi:hypothetical protein